MNQALMIAQRIAGGGGTPAFVQDDGASFDPFSTSRSVTFGSTTASGNCILAIYRGSNSASLVVTDNKGNSYSLAVDGATSGIAMAVAPNITGGASHQVTFTITSSANPGYIIIMEISGIAAASPVDDVDQLSSFIANASVNLDTTGANAFLVGALFTSAGGATVGAGYTLRHVQDTSFQTESRVAGAAGTYAVNWIHSERTANLTAIALKAA